MPADELCHAQILHDDRIDARLRHLVHADRKILPFCFLDEGIDRKQGLDLVQARVPHRLLHRVDIEAGGSVPGIEAGAAEIYRVTAGSYGAFQAVHIAGRSQ